MVLTSTQRSKSGQVSRSPAAFSAQRMWTVWVISVEHASHVAFMPDSSCGAAATVSGPPVSRGLGLRFVTVMAAGGRRDRLLTGTPGVLQRSETGWACLTAARRWSSDVMRRR